MIVRVERLLKKARRLVSRSRWLAKLLGYQSFAHSSIQPGLVLIQIDGLSQREFRRALSRGELPFLKRLLDRENYQEQSHYSGLPATTPAVQAELFYGIKAAVPAFSFRDPDTRRIVRMYEPATAAAYEKKLDEQCPDPLMEGGSAYCNIFTGGAAESHFCASTMDVKDVLTAANPFTLALLVITNPVSVLRIAALLVVETVVAFADLFSGVARNHSLGRELKFVLSRVFVCILLRELLVIGARIDVERGLPIVQMNFVGYDEQAHRRGPTSAFAHWTLKGIDYAIKRVWTAAQAASRRQYDVWIYSDHGQCVATSFFKFRGYAIEEAINRAFAKLDRAVPLLDAPLHGASAERCCLLGSHHRDVIRHRGVGEEKITEAHLRADELQAVGLGPVGFIYPDRLYSKMELAVVAEALVKEHGVPVAVMADEQGHLHATTAAGRFRLPEQTSAIFGNDHPFLADLAEDLVRLCEHKNAGEIVILGWCQGSKALTFVAENGSHAGLTLEETNPFSLLPKDTQLPDNGKSYLRPGDLRAAALHFLGRKLYKSAPRWKPYSTADTSQTLKVMTYNVHSCIGLDGKLDVARISRVIAQAKPDVVALQELDLNKVRSGMDDQAQLIAGLLEMNYQFHPALRLEEEEYGDAILTHLPMKTVKTGLLPATRAGTRREPRGALWVTVNFKGVDVHIINTHLGLMAAEQMEQTSELLGEEWLQPLLKGNEAIILCGDFNFRSSSKAYKRITAHLMDAQLQLKKHKPKNTFYSRFPMFRIDHIFNNSKLEVVSIEVPRSRTARDASDHLPLIAEFKVKP